LQNGEITRVERCRVAARFLFQRQLWKQGAETV
jgi:hypothetical protein